MKMVFTTDELINANEHAKTLGHPRTMRPEVYETLDPEGRHVIVETWGFPVATGLRSRVVLKIKGVASTVHDNYVWIDIHDEDLKE